VASTASRSDTKICEDLALLDHRRARPNGLIDLSEYDIRILNWEVFVWT
jgi:hypothetical protein